MNVSECIVCEIVRGQAEASTVHEDETAVALMDIQPVTPGHLLVVPWEHVPGLDEIEETLGVHMWRVAHRLARALRRSGLRCAGINLFLADGEAAFQEVFHAHLHVFPRFANDNFRVDADWRVRERVELDRSAAAVRAGLATLSS
ncbi:HIT family protein [Nocardiopsis gilva YIM 90087]|uniref:HIT family protein n=1 Tax=Nocardiopsis gilva YIM 90087 TaxID=1235441 RepID=A0A223S7C7_9ACTN|nr:HIT family protein [Nocardiopsis gilva]ASU84026.1 HIT family protein [Nocardiopsis gilva YIM 90087]